MGGSASIVQHERGSRSTKAEETSLLRLYNRNRRGDRLSKEHQNLPTTTGDSEPWHQRPASSAVAGRQQLRHPEVQAISGRDRRESEAIFRCHENTTVAGDEKRRQVVDDLAARNSSGWRDERVRARDKTMLQMYNRCEDDMGTAVATLRESLHQCSIDGTGWATVTAVSALLEQAGVVVDDGMVLLLANQERDNPESVGSAEERFPHAATAAAPSGTRLVHWPSIVDFLEEGPSGDDETWATCSCESKKRQLGPSSSSATTQSAKTPRLCGESAVPMRADDELATSGQGGNGSNPEVTPESTAVESRRGCAGDGGGVREQNVRDSCGGTVLLERGLREIEAGLREVEFDGARLPGSRIADTMDSIIDILKAQAGVHWDGWRWGDTRPIGGVKGPHDDVRRRDYPAVAFNDCRTAEGRSETLQKLDTERMAGAACAAGKRGDIYALEGLANNVDLRTTDEFDRNALYYASLCGHVRAAHFVVLHAYGGIKGIPEKERSECRTNALSDEMRQYLDTGVLPDEAPVRISKSDESRPVQAVPPAGEKGQCSTTSAQSTERGGAAESLENGTGRAETIHGSSATDEHHAASPADATISIASLFGWGHDREKNEDY